MRSVFVLVLCFLLINITYSQTPSDETFITIGAQKVTTGEFERIFNKNNSIATAEKQSLEEYLQMYINFKLKVQAAMDAGYDTTSAFRTELRGYRDQLAKSYLTDNKAVDSLIEEAYQRMHTEVSASHIMAALRTNPTPADTLEAWSKIMTIRQRLLQGEDFAKLALELSDDPSAKNNNGNLGYFTAFQMVYPFESAAYNCKIGEISMPVRSRFGYHLVKTTDKRPARGEVKVAHIMLMVPQGSADSSWISAERRIKDIYSRLRAGADFSSLAKDLSEDRGSARNGGELPAFGTGRMVPEFEQAAFKLQFPGDISEPVRTFYGWHIISLIEKKGIPDFEKVKMDIKSKIARDERAEHGSVSFINSLKKEYNFSGNEILLEELFEPPAVDLKKENTGKTPKSQPLKPAVPKKLKTAVSPDKAQEILFRFAGQSFKLSDFQAYLSMLPKPDSAASATDFIHRSYSNFVKKEMLEYENSILESKFEDFRNLIQEYHDGILLFNISDSLVWSKASKDTAGLEKFFRENQSDYAWPERLEATIIKCKTQETANKALKIARKLKTHPEIGKQLFNLVCDTAKKENCIETEYNKFTKSENQVIDTIKWKPGISQVLTINGNFVFVVVHNLLKPSPKSLDDSRGIAISDYQNTLDKEWIADLRKKYQINMNYEVLNRLKAKYESKK